MLDCKLDLKPGEGIGLTMIVRRIIVEKEARGNHANSVSCFEKLDNIPPSLVQHALGGIFSVGVCNIWKVGRLSKATKISKGEKQAGIDSPVSS